MSAIPCPECGRLRKVEQVATPDGWRNPACSACGDPGWTQPYDADDPLAGRPATDDALFGEDGLRVAPSPDEADLTYGERQRRRQAALIANGYHPLAGPLRNRLRLHPDADRALTRDAHQSGPTCGTCRFRVAVGGHARDFPKCLFGKVERVVTDEERRAFPLLYRGVPEGATRTTYPRVSHADATDVRAWWPACGDWAARDPDA